MAKSFIEEFTEACERISGNNSHIQTEVARVHREAVRDKDHAFSRVEIAKPNPWKHGTGLTI